MTNNNIQRVFLENKEVINIEKSSLVYEHGGWELIFTQLNDQEEKHSYHTYVFKVISISMISGGDPQTLILELEPKSKLRTQPLTK